MSTIQGLIRFLLPRDTRWYDMLEELGSLCRSATIELAKFEHEPADKVRASVQEIEHRADDVVRTMEDALARTFVTPIDREDLHHLTSELDDIIDLCNRSARAFDLYHHNAPTPAMIAVMGKLCACADILANRIPCLRTHRYGALLEAGRSVRALERETDAIYRSAISDLFADSHPDFRAMMRQKEALDGLEDAVDSCGNVANLLANLAVKHG